MDERILMTADFSTEDIKKEGEKKKTDSFIGSLIPLVIPVIYLLYMLIEEAKFSDMNPLTFLLVFLLPIGVSGLLHHFSKNQANIDSDKNIKQTENQSLIISDTLISGNTNQQSFSMPICDIVKIYSSQTHGQKTELIIRNTSGNTLVFNNVKNVNDIISCIEHLKSSHVCFETSVEKSDDKFADELHEEKLFDVIITSGKPSSVAQLKAIRSLTQCDLVEAKTILSTLPYTIATSKTGTQAKKLKSDLENSGIEVKLTEKK